MIIDVHAHLTAQKFREMSAALDGRVAGPEVAAYPLPAGHTRPSPSSDSTPDVEGRLALMDEAGVQMQILSQLSGGHRNEQVIEAVQASNDIYAALVRQYPKRFGGYAALPLPHIDASVRELQRGLDDLGLIGAVLPCRVLREYSPTDPMFAPIFEEANRRGTTIYFHPLPGGGNVVVDPLSQSAGLANGLYAPLEDTLIVADLLTRRFATRYPNIKFVIAHMGGAIPMLVERIEHESSPRLAEPVDEPLSTSMRKFYYDSVTHFSTPAIMAGWMEFGAGRIMAGSDYPITLYFGQYKENFNAIERLEIPASDVENILSGTAKKVFGLTV